uniref:Plant disease resistance polyprotein-like protein n=2 Tax=Oryza sativa subsp. japonica TaxID=39947 RepID=Q7XJ05_ORYSJ|nr:plant disease resistance polyprotein -like protein [Oryza sativa Japonica Group]
MCQLHHLREREGAGERGERRAWRDGGRHGRRLDLLRLILRRLDTRSALATAALSKRWPHLSRHLPALDFRVTDVIPEPDRYHWYLRRRRTAGDRRRPVRVSTLNKLDVIIGRYERHGMRSLANSVNNFLDADDDDGGNGEAHRRYQRVSLEVFPTHNSGHMNRLIATAIADWSVQDLEVTILDTTSNHGSMGYSFPHHCFDDDAMFPAATGCSLKTLKLTNCAPLAVAGGGGDLQHPPRVFGSLTVLVLQGMPMSTRYEGVVRACPRLEVLHLRLERLACVGGEPVEFSFGAVPRLARLSLSFHADVNATTWLLHTFAGMTRNEYPLFNFLNRLPDLDTLVLRFTGPERWVAPAMLHDDAPLRRLRRLLVADMPPSWDLTWTRYLLEAAAALETLHIHVDVAAGTAASPGRRVAWPTAAEFKHRALRELVIVGYRPSEWQHEEFVSLMMSTCVALRDVALLEHGHVRAKGHWDWELMT